MAEYQYRMITPEGKEKKGTMEAKSAEQLRMLLKSQKNIVLSVDRANLMTRDIKLPFGNKVQARDFSIFCRQFVSILDAGVSIIKALEMMAEQTENQTLQKAIREIYEEVSKGETLAGAMRKRSGIFSPMFCNMVEAGEESGSLEVSFSRMAVQFEKDNKLKSSIKKAITYPIVLLVVMLGVIVLMLAWVIPTFLEMFEQLDSELPGITQMVLNISHFVRAEWWLLIIGVVTATLAFKAYAASTLGQKTLGAFALKIPVYGKLQTKTECARLGRTMSTLIGAGVPMVEAISITGRSMTNYHYRKAMNLAKEQVTRGVTFSRPLKVSGLFPAMVVHMVAIGEETGNLEEMLENLADYYEDDVQVATEQLMALLEPMIIVVMALVVGVLIMAVLAPMFELYSAI